jgi:chromosome segregation ATPase
MSTLSEILNVLRKGLLMAEDLKRTSENLDHLTEEVREHDRRITRLEAQWDTALKLSGGKERRK